MSKRYESEEAERESRAMRRLRGVRVLFFLLPIITVLTVNVRNHLARLGWYCLLPRDLCTIRLSPMVDWWSRSGYNE